MTPTDALTINKPATGSLEQEIERLRECALADQLPFAYGGPVGSGDMRLAAEDFFVSEVSGVELTSSGEHLWVRLRKTGQNTRWVGKQLADFAQVSYRNVSYAGLKDRHARAEQWFSIQLPGREDPDWSALNLPGVEVLESARHDRKIRPGQLSMNRFRIVLRNCGDYDKELLEQRLAHVRQFGVPNYFGAQRFGRDLGNLDLVLRQPQLRRLNRETRSFALSALRSALFNGQLANRVSANSWKDAIPGDAILSDRPRGSAEHDVSVFAPQRFPAGVLWGSGYGGSSADARELELAWFNEFPLVRALLEKAGARFSRRVLCARVGELECNVEPDSLVFSFALGPGVFATMVLREILMPRDVAIQEN